MFTGGMFVFLICEMMRDWCVSTGILSVMMIWFSVGYVVLSWLRILMRNLNDMTQEQQIAICDLIDYAERAESSLKSSGLVFQAAVADMLADRIAKVRKLFWYNIPSLLCTQPWTEDGPDQIMPSHKARLGNAGSEAITWKPLQFAGILMIAGEIPWLGILVYG
jgi:hypothetical protein